MLLAPLRRLATGLAAILALACLVPAHAEDLADEAAGARQADGPLMAYWMLATS